MLQLDLHYDHDESEASALRLVYQIYPRWKTDEGEVEIKQFTDGIMNTLLKITKHNPDASDRENEKSAVLLRAYGRDSEILIDRDMEAKTHEELTKYGLAAPLLARFRNGLLYGFIPGRICEPSDLLNEPVWRAIASRLGEWHAKLDVASAIQERDGQSPRTIWTVLKEWVAAIPTSSDAAKARKISLEKELEIVLKSLDRGDKMNFSKYVIGHCDLLSANIIITQGSDAVPLGTRTANPVDVRFIDYEYAVACPAGFDLANHLSEWGGYDCDYSRLPGRATRRQFVQVYLESFTKHASDRPIPSLDELCDDIDRYRGLPGFCWGTHALIQDAISDVKFDWKSYSEKRLAEFWAWRHEVDGTRVEAGAEQPFRERQWLRE